MIDNRRKTTKMQKMSMNKNERLLIEKFKMINPVEKLCEEENQEKNKRNNDR